MGAPLLIDIGHLCEHHTDVALEEFYKAVGEPPDDAIWDPHPSPFIQRIVELFTERGLTRIAGLQAEMDKWITGEAHRADLARSPRPAGAMARWTPAELAVAKLYLQSLPPAEFRLDDWMMLVDYLAQRYLPEDDLRSEADWLATRSGLMGRVEAAMRGEITNRQVERLLSAVPERLAAIGMSPAQAAAIDYGRARAAENVVGLADATRHRLRRSIIDWQEAEFSQVAGARRALQTKLLDDFAALNRDWRRIAVTEAGENLNQGLIASVGPGGKVKRVEKYRGACAWCRSIDGRVMSVVAADAPDKDGETHVWPGKTNLGRSASPMKREGGRLIEREPKERFWIAAGTQHPNCRGGWIKLEEPTRAVDPKFSAWMDEVLRRK